MADEQREYVRVISIMTREAGAVTFDDAESVSELGSFLYVLDERRREVGAVPIASVLWWRRDAREIAP